MEKKTNQFRRVWVTDNMFLQFTRVADETTLYEIVIDHFGPYEVNFVVYEKTLNLSTKDAEVYYQDKVKMIGSTIVIEDVIIDRTDYFDHEVFHWKPSILDSYFNVTSKRGKITYYAHYEKDKDCAILENMTMLYDDKSYPCARFWYDRRNRLVNMDYFSK